MTGECSDPPPEPVWQMEAFPDDFARGVTVLVASAGDPTRYAIDLRALCEYGGNRDTGLVVTTTRSADTTLETYENVCPESDRAALGFVDTTARHPAVPALYGDASTIYIPSPGDLERLVLALSNLSENMPPSSGTRHLVIRSLTPILDVTPASRVSTVLERITGLRTQSGLCILGIDYTAHEQETLATIAKQADGVLWVTESGSNTLAFDYQTTHGRYHDEIADIS